MTYTKRVWHAPSGREGVAPTARDMGNIDNALFDQDVRIAALEVIVADFETRIATLEDPP